jgi:hypothetical protein
MKLISPRFIGREVSAIGWMRFTRNSLLDCSGRVQITPPFHLLCKSADHSNQEFILEGTLKIMLYKQTQDLHRWDVSCAPIVAQFPEWQYEIDIYTNSIYVYSVVLLFNDPVNLSYFVATVLYPKCPATRKVASCNGNPNVGVKDISALSY